MLTDHSLKDSKESVQILSSVFIIRFHPNLWFPKPTEKEQRLIESAESLAECIMTKDEFFSEEFPGRFKEYERAYLEYHLEADQSLFCTMLLDFHDLNRQRVDLEQYQRERQELESRNESPSSTDSNLSDTVQRMRSSIQKLNGELLLILKRHPEWRPFREDFTRLLLVCKSHYAAQKSDSHATLSILLQQNRELMAKYGDIGLYFMETFWPKTHFHELEEIMEQAFWDLIDHDLRDHDLSYTLIQVKDIGNRLANFYRNHPERHQRLQETLGSGLDDIPAENLQSIMLKMHEEIKKLCCPSQDSQLDDLADDLGLFEEQDDVWKWLSESFPIFLKEMHRHIDIINQNLQILANGGLSKLNDLEAFENNNGRCL